MPKTARPRAALAETWRRKLLRLRCRHWGVARIAGTLRVPITTVVAATREFDPVGLALS